MSTIQNQPGASWLAIIRKHGTPEFADAFNSDVQLAGSVLPEILKGIDSISAVFGEASKMYDSITFTHEAVEGAHTYLTWEASFFGTPVSGATILTRDDFGKIRLIQLFHRSLGVVKQFAEELERRLAARKQG